MSTDEQRAKWRAWDATHRAQRNAYSAAHREHHREYDRAYSAAHREELAAKAKERRLKNPIVAAEKRKRYATSHLHERAVGLRAERAVKNGHIAKPDKCSACGVGDVQIEGHHFDYDKPLDVIWLCRPCHKKAHRRTP